jgi:hypothetical protein
MTDPADWLDLLKALQGLGFFGGIVAVLVVVYKGWYVSQNEADRRVADVETKFQVYREASEEKVKLLQGELEKREGLYVASLAELRATIKEGVDQREKVQQALDKNIEQMYRFTDALGDMRDAIRSSPRGRP